MRTKPGMGSKREGLITTAVDLFAKQGFHANGIDTILEQSGVAKRTLYMHFRSKEELIIARMVKKLMRPLGSGISANPVWSKNSNLLFL